MVRSLSLVLVLVGVAFFLAQPPRSDEQRVRVVDPAGDVSAFRAAHPGVPVPGPAPTGWRTTVSRSTADLLRVGYVTAAGTYVEYAAGTSDPAQLRTDLLADAPATGSVAVGPVSWERVERDGAVSLVRSVAGATVVVGTRRGNAALPDLLRLAGALTR